MIRAYSHGYSTVYRPEGDSVVGPREHAHVPWKACLWYGPERGWEPVKEKE